MWFMIAFWGGLPPTVPNDERNPSSPGICECGEHYGRYWRRRTSSARHQTMSHSGHISRPCCSNKALGQRKPSTHLVTRQLSSSTRGTRHHAVRSEAMQVTYGTAADALHLDQYVAVASHCSRTRRAATMFATSPHMCFEGVAEGAPQRQSSAANASYARGPKQCVMSETIIALRSTRMIAIMDVVELTLSTASGLAEWSLALQQEPQGTTSPHPAH